MWDDLDIQKKSELMRLFIKNNIYSLDKMKEMYNDTTERQYSSGGQIQHIASSKRGTFKAQASRMGMTVQEAASHILANKGNYSPAMVKKANFARNFAHADGGNLFFTGGPFATDPPTYNFGLPLATGTAGAWGDAKQTEADKQFEKEFKEAQEKYQKQHAQRLIEEAKYLDAVYKPQVTDDELTAEKKRYQQYMPQSNINIEALQQSKQPYFTQGTKSAEDLAAKPTNTDDRGIIGKAIDYAGLKLTPGTYGTTYKKDPRTGDWVTQRQLIDNNIEEIRPFTDMTLGMYPVTAGPYWTLMGARDLYNGNIFQGTLEFVPGGYNIASKIPKVYDFFYRKTPQYKSNLKLINVANKYFGLFGDAYKKIPKRYMFSTTKTNEAVQNLINQSNTYLRGVRMPADEDLPSLIKAATVSLGHTPTEKELYEFMAITKAPPTGHGRTGGFRSGAAIGENTNYSSNSIQTALGYAQPNKYGPDEKIGEIIGVRSPTIFKDYFLDNRIKWFEDNIGQLQHVNHGVVDDGGLNLSNRFLSTILRTGDLPKTDLLMNDKYIYQKMKQYGLNDGSYDLLKIDDTFDRLIDSYSYAKHHKIGFGNYSKETVLNDMLKRYRKGEKISIDRFYNQFKTFLIKQGFPEKKLRILSTDNVSANELRANRRKLFNDFHLWLEDEDIIDFNLKRFAELRPNPIFLGNDFTLNKEKGKINIFLEENPAELNLKTTYTTEPFVVSPKLNAKYPFLFKSDILGPRFNISKNPYMHYIFSEVNQPQDHIPLFHIDAKGLNIKNYGRAHKGSYTPKVNGIKLSGTSFKNGGKIK